MDSFFWTKMPAHKEQEIMKRRRLFYMGGLFRMVDRCAVELHARSSSGVSLSLRWVILKLASSWGPALDFATLEAL